MSNKNKSENSFLGLQGGVWRDCGPVKPASQQSRLGQERPRQDCQSVPEVLGGHYRTGVRCLVMFDFYVSFGYMLSPENDGSSSLAKKL